MSISNIIIRQSAIMHRTTSFIIYFSHSQPILRMDDASALVLCLFNTTPGTYCSHKWSTICRTYGRMCQQWTLSSIVLRTHAHLKTSIHPMGEGEGGGRTRMSERWTMDVCDFEECEFDGKRTWLPANTRKYIYRGWSSCKRVDWIIHQCLIGTRA